MQESSTELKCAHYNSRYLPITENWIYKTLINHKKFYPVFLTRGKQNLQLFPIKTLYSLDDYGKLRQYVEILLFRLVGYFVFFKEACLKRNVQILHVHFGYHGVKLLGLKRALNIPMICSFYGDDAFSFPRSNRNKRKYQKLFREADKILVLGEYMKAELIKLGCKPEKITIHHLGIDTKAVRYEKRVVSHGESIRFLIASSFVSKKGIDVALKALIKLKHKFQFTIDIVGDGPLKTEIVRIIETNNIADKVTLHGYKPYDYFINLAYKCHVFLQASRTTESNNKEGTPMAIVDAMATGMAVISTKHSDIPEIVKDEHNGLLAEENDIDGFADCIEKILHEPSLIETFSENGRAWIEKEFDACKQTQMLEAYYTTLIAT